MPVVQEARFWVGLLVFIHLSGNRVACLVTLMNWLSRHLPHLLRKGGESAMDRLFDPTGYNAHCMQHRQQPSFSQGPLLAGQRMRQARPVPSDHYCSSFHQQENILKNLIAWNNIFVRR
jgi:hypothetical protein